MPGDYRLYAQVWTVEGLHKEWYDRDFVTLAPLTAANLGVCYAFIGIAGPFFHLKKGVRGMKIKFLDGTERDFKSLRNADLWGADLRHANLRHANLRGADLQWANLRGADLQYADLQDADLRDADLRDADLRGADLRDADLRGASLYNTIGNGHEIQTIQTPLYIINVVRELNIIQIGCERYTIDEWFNFSDEEIEEMDGDRAIEWWNIYKPIIRLLIDAEDT